MEKAAFVTRRIRCHLSDHAIRGENDPEMTGVERMLLETVVMAAGAVVQGAVGFGLNLVAVPLLVLIDPRLVPGPVLVAALVLTILVLRRERRAVDFAGLGWAFAGRLPGTELGVAALLMLPPSSLSLVFAGLVLIAVLMSASGMRLRPTRGTLLIAGALSGFMSTTSAVGGPPMALVYQDAAGPRLRGTLAGYFVAGALISIFALTVAGRFGAAEARASLSLLPGVVIGFALSARAARKLDAGYIRPAVLLLAGVASMTVIVRQLFVSF